MTDRDEEPGQGAAGKGNGKSGKKLRDGQGQKRAAQKVKAPKDADKDQAREARRTANQAAREAARAEHQAERARRKQDRAGADPDQDAKARPKKPKDKIRKEKLAKSGSETPKASKSDQQGSPDLSAKNQADPATKPVGFVPFVALPASRPDPLPEDMPKDDIEAPPFNILLVGQAGPIARQAAIFAASLRMFSPKWRGRLIIAEPRPEAAWQGTATRIGAPERELLQGYGAEILPFTAQHFGRSYPYGNKIEALSLLPASQPFVFFDSDTIITGPLGRCAIDFSRPTASMRREGSWPEPPLYGPGYGDIWRALYDRFGLDFESSLDLDQPDEHWERYLYFNAGWFLGDDPAAFGGRFLDWALALRDDPGEVLASQSLDPWLDQAVLPLVIHALGGGRPGPDLRGFDGGVTCHYRNLSLLYAREADSAITAMERVLALPEMVSLVQPDASFDRLVRQGAGRSQIRPIFQGKPLPSKEKAIRQELKKQGLWFGR